MNKYKCIVKTGHVGEDNYKEEVTIMEAENILLAMTKAKKRSAPDAMIRVERIKKDMEKNTRKVVKE